MLEFLVGVAWSAPQTPSEEIVVYADDFARWDKTRWFLQEELVLPSGLILSSENNLSFKTHALQIRAIVACDKDAKLSARKWEVSCAIEDLGILTTTVDDWGPSRRDRVQQVLDQVDARLVGTKIQLQVDEEGGIVNFDLEGIQSDNLRERQAQEAMRTLVTQLMSGFHLRIPSHAQRDGQTVENHSELMDIPSLTAARGSTLIVHQASTYQGNRLVQSVGEGTMAVAVTYVGTDMFNQSELVHNATMTATSGPGVGAKTIGVTAVVFPPPTTDTPTETSLSGPPKAGEIRETDIDAIWDMKMSGVALFQKSTGIMTERVWTCSGTPTQSTASGIPTGPYLNVGRLRILGPTERPSVGPSKQVAWPGQVMDGLDPWVELEKE